MEEISELDFLHKCGNKLNVKMSNMSMNIHINFSNIKRKPKSGLWIEKKQLEKYVVPTFTKKIFSHIKNNL